MSLDQATAIERSSLLRPGSVSYNYSIILMASQYYGLAELTFYLERIDLEQLKLDFTAYDIQNIVVNTVHINVDTTPNFLLLPKACLQKGRNKVSVMYTNKYDKDRKGCITFNDKGKQYVYTDFEPYSAHRVFPCFDQPNIKCPMKIAIVSPSDWTAISNQPALSSSALDQTKFKKHANFSHSASNDLLESFLSRAEDDSIMTLFDYTQQISTYLFSFAAGFYDWIQAPEGTVEFPLRFYCVSSSIFLEAEISDFMIELTQKLLVFYSSYFGQPYPFKKLDQLFVRYYDSEGMENPGLVTYDESMTILPYSSESHFLYIGYIIAHELAHQWHGGLVTMEWWDDVWLNESFADFLTTYSLRKINSSLSHPLISSDIFFRGEKIEAYEADERSTGTHPVHGSVLNTNVATSIFDRITYMKGASILKQLMFLIGEGNFQTALKNYFERFKWSNTTLNDFFSDIQPFFPSGDIAMQDWISDWFETSSLNVLESNWDPSITSSKATLKLNQKAYSSQHPTLRYHKLQVAFFNASAEVTETQEVTIPRGATEVNITYDGSKGISAVLVNYNDHAYLQSYLDSQSTMFFKENILKISADQTRALAWYSMSELCRQALMKVDEYATFVLKNIFKESNTYIMDKMLEQLLNYIQSYLSDSDIQVQTTVIFNVIYLQMQDKSVNDQDTLQILYKYYIVCARSDEQILMLKKFLKGEDFNLKDRQILDENLPWEIVKKVFTLTDTVYLKEDKWGLFFFVEQTDNSYRADDARTVCETTSLRTAEELQLVYASFKSAQIDLTAKYGMAEGWNSSNHEELISSFSSRYFEDLLPLSKSLSYNFYEFFYKQLRPSNSDFSSLIYSYNSVISTLKQDPDLLPHANNMENIVDQLTLRSQNTKFNADTNLTLTQQRAIQRYNYIRGGSISYISHIAFADLDQSSTYSGLTEITFELTSIPSFLLPLDFICQEIQTLIVNGKEVKPLQSGEYLMILWMDLKVGVNNIAVRYMSTYNNDGLGCMAFTDTTVDPPQYYTYTKFEPNGAHRFFPCFDQPDLKAKALFNVILPSTWIANGNESHTYSADFDEADYIAHSPHQNQDLLTQYLKGKSGKFYNFAQTQLLPTYLYCIVAGEYFTVDLPADQRYNNIPMTLYSLSSYEEALISNKDFIFEITKLAVQFYQSKFKVPYQFSKYDSIFCHEFASGAMENPGIITFNDTYLYQEAVSIDKMVQLGVTIVHECAHNWFGDYVTMKWWDDLWLNQSFADFMAYFCMDGIKDLVTTLTEKYTSGWLGAVARVVGGYRQDQMTTTHPIRSAVPNTSLATAYFDNITYRKGLSTLKQLMFLMGEDNFFKGVTDYFTKFSWSNGTIDNFLASMNQFYVNPTPDYTLQVWKEMWLLTASLNVLTITWDPQSTDAAAILTINQTAFSVDYSTLRYHMVNVAFFKADGSYTTQKVLINNTNQTTLTYDASAGIKAILINEGLQGYLKYVIDEASLSFFQSSMNNINKGNAADDALTRMITYFYMNEMVRDGLARVVPYRDVVLNLISAQTEDSVYSFELNFLNESTGSFIPLSSRAGARETIFTFVLGQLASFVGKEGGEIGDQVNRIKILKDLLPVLCSNEDEIDNLNQWRLGNYAELVNYPISLSQAWSVVKLVYTSSHYTSDQKTAIFDDQNSKTPGITASLALNTVLALSANDSSFDTIYQVFKEVNESVNVKMSFSEGWNHPVHLTLLVSQYYPRFFMDIPIVSRILPGKHFEFFYTNLKPIDDDFETTIASFQAVSLPGSNMLGHRNNIQKIIDIYKLRQKLYQVNT